MIRAIVGASLRFRLLVVAAAALTMAVGVTQLRGAPVDVLPEFSPPYVEIQTEALGLSAEEVEQLITVPMEADLLNGVEGIDVLRSQSVPGMSSIVLVFEPDADLYKSRALVQERIAQMGAAAMPNVSKPPVMLQPYSSSSRLLMFGLSSEKVSPIEKSVMARWTIQPRLLGVPGVANVSIWGFRDRQLQVQVDPERLRDRGVTLKQVVETTANAQISSPLSFVEGSTPGTGGFIETPQQRLGVRHVFDRLTNPAELGKVPVDGTGGRLRLADVANVVEDHQPLIGDAVVNDSDGLLLVVEKFPGANTLEVTRGVEKALDDLRPGLGGMAPDTSVFRPATFIEGAIDNLVLASVIAGLLLALAIAAFLFEWRTVLLSLFTIPLSLVTAGLVVHLLGETFNAISFAGLAVALAVVVDDAVVGAENVARRLRQQPRIGGETSTADIVRDATHEVRSPLAYATVIVVLAIVPVAVMDGRPGAFFEPLALAYAVAVGAAMVVALTVTPALSLLLFSRGSAGRRESPLLQRVGRRYGEGLGRFIRRPRMAVVAAGACLAAVVVALAVLPLLGTSLIPSFKDRDMLVRLNAEPGTSNSRMTQIATEVSRELRSIPGVDNVGAHVGRAVTGDRIVDVNSADVWVSIDSDADYDATVASIEDAIAQVPGARSDLLTYAEQEIRDVGALREGENPVTGDGLDVLTGSDRPLVVRVYGQSFDGLRREASKVRQLMSQVEGVVDPRVEQPVEQPNVEIEVDLDKAREVGIKPGDVRRAEATLVQGLLVGSVFEEQKVFEVVVQGTPETRRSVESIRDLLIDRPGGGHVRLGDVAEVRITNTPIAIARDAVSRYLDVEAGVSGRSLDSVAGEIENRLQNSVFPLEYHAEVLTQTTSTEINLGMMLAAALAAALAAFLLMQAAFRSWRLAALAFLTMPVALLGGALAALANGAELSLGSALGLVALFGIAAHNGVMLICHFQRLRETEGEAFGPALVERGSRERLAPILTTASALALVALPFVILGSRPGLEIVSPMALVVLGGLATSTFLGLFLLPALYLRFGGREPAVLPEEELLHRWADVEPAPAAAAAGADVTLVSDLLHRPARVEPEPDETAAKARVTRPEPDGGNGSPLPPPVTSSGETDEAAASAEGRDERSAR
jgi:CzcA family heavy metal efflux pump